MTGTNENVEYLSTPHGRSVQKKSKAWTKSDKGIHMGYTFDLRESPFWKTGEACQSG